MAFATVEDFTGGCDAVVFGSVYSTVKDVLRPDACVFIQGKLDKRREAPSIKVDQVVPLAEASGKLRVTLSAELTIEDTTEDHVRKFRELLHRFRGDDPVLYTFRRAADGAKAGPYRTAATFKVKAGDELKREILELLPTAKIVIGAQWGGKPAPQKETVGARG
jgi:DNA polymerase III alpha subunit